MPPASLRACVPIIAFPLLALTTALPAQQRAAGATVADYARARGLEAIYTAATTGAAEQPTWLDGVRLRYRKSVAGGEPQYVVVDATNREAPVKRQARPEEMPATNANGAGAPGAGPGGGPSGGPGGPPREVASPDGKRIAYIANHNVYVRDAAAPPAAGIAGSMAAGIALSIDGSEGNPFTAQSLAWSPDSRKLAAYRVRPGYRRLVRYVISSPADQLQPRYMEREYAKPGDLLDLQQPALFDVEARTQVNVDPSLFPDPFNLSNRPQWRRDGRAFTFEYNERGHQRFRIIEVDAQTGRARALVDEVAQTFIDYRRAAGTLTDGGRVHRHDVNDGAEIIWLSERDGWAHLYLYDGRTGQVKNQITKGEFVVRAVHRVDEAARTIIFSAGGMAAGQDPYFRHYYRINFDGTGLVALTDAPADHLVTFSGDFSLYVDTWSRVDLAPVSQLRRTSDGKVLLELERGDLSALAKAGWRAPEVFTAKGRDGTTDIWGIVVKPTRFDPRKRYPVIEYIYAGPHGSFVPKSFSAYLSMQAIAELGFVVVQIDGMGTANRSRPFHDVAWKNIGDAGFPDRILWHRAYAARNAWYDTSRVGIFGGSAGGQNSLGALLFHPEFYKVAVSFAGCHDNRMDKIWWNEQWMGYPIGPEYAASSNVVHAHKLQGQLLLVVPELDTNVDPSSTMQVVNALIKADKQFDLLVMPNEDHGGGRRGPSAAYGDRKMWDFFVQHLQGARPPMWNSLADVVAPRATGGAAGGTGDGALFGASWEALAASWFRDDR